MGQSGRLGPAPEAELTAAGRDELQHSGKDVRAGRTEVGGRLPLHGADGQSEAGGMPCASVAEYRQLEAAYAEIQRRHAEREADNAALLALNERLAKANATGADLMAELEGKNESLRDLSCSLAGANAVSAELMAELHEKNEVLLRTNRELARANAHAAELMAIIELKDEEIQKLNASLAEANVRAADLIAEREFRLVELASLNSKLRTEVKQRSVAQDRALEETAKLSAMISGMAEGVVFVDSHDNIAEVNDYYLSLTGRSRSDLAGGSLRDLQYPPAALLESHIDRFRSDPHAAPSVIQGAWEGLEILLRLQPIYREGRYRGSVLNLIDVTELVAARREALAASHAKSRFLANMSHELRTPLNAVLGFSQVMARSDSMPLEHQENLQSIMRSGEHLLTLINQVLDLSKIEAERITLIQTDFDLHRLLYDLEDMFRLKAQGKGLGLTFMRANNVPRWVRTDEVKLRQVLINLLNNALKFTDSGGVAVRTTVRDLGRSHPGSADPTLRIEVEDTGPGIALAEMDKLFEPFVQASLGEQGQQGTGLGLPISRGFVELMGGEMGVSSQPGRGSVFGFDLPVAAVAASRLQEREAVRRVLALEPGQPRFRVLVVDDVEDSRRLLVKLLVPLGFDLREASDGQKAIEVWEEWSPHLIWMDIRMPVMDGYEATRQIKASPAGRTTAIIALVASDFEDERVTALSAGFDDSLQKPFREADLFEMMSRHLGVRYITAAAADTHAAADLGCGPMVLSLATLADVAPDLLTDLEHAAIRIDTEAIDTAVDEIRVHDAPLADALAARVNDFAYDEILVMAQEARKSR